MFLPKNHKQILFALALAVLLISPVAVFAQNDDPQVGDTPETSLICRLTGLTTGDDITTCVRRLYNFALGVSGIVALMVTVFAGYLYMSAGGDGEQLKTAKDLIGAVIGGIVILATAFILLQFLDPRLTELKEPFKFAPVSTTVGGTQPGTTTGTTPTVPAARTALENAIISAASLGTLDPEWDPTGRVLTTVYDYCRSLQATQRRGICFNEEVRLANDLSLTALQTIIQARGTAYTATFSITGWVEGASHTSNSGEHGPAAPFCLNAVDPSITSCGSAVDFNKIDGIDISEGTTNRTGIIQFAKYLFMNLNVRNAYGPSWLVNDSELQSYKNSGILRYLGPSEATHFHVRFQ